MHNHPRLTGFSFRHGNGREWKWEEETGRQCDARYAYETERWICPKHGDIGGEGYVIDCTMPCCIAAAEAYDKWKPGDECADEDDPSHSCLMCNAIGWWRVCVQCNGDNPAY